MRMPRSIVVPLALAGSALAVQAQTIAPGLWDVTVNVKSAGGELEAGLARMQQEMARLPPDQRKMMEEMMARQGVAVGAGGVANSFRHCVSKEQAERGDVPQDADGRCKRDSLERSGSTMRFKFSCANPPTTGTGEFKFSSDKAYTMRLLVDSAAGGQTQRMEMNQSAKWVAADCGSLKPRR